MFESDSTLEWAEFWIYRGWRVLPLHNIHPKGGCTCNKGADCKSAGKHPRIRNWTVETSTDDLSMVGGWLQRWPHMNLGGVPPAGTVVVDGDARHSTDGSNPLADWPPTETHISGSGEGSEHRIYVDINGHFETQASISASIDVRLPAKGQIVLPPSLHASGRRYLLADDRPPDLFPYHLLDTGVSAQPVTAPRKGVLSAWIDGSAHSYDLEVKTAARLANIFVNGGGSDAEFEAIMRLVDSHGEDPDLSNVDKFYGLIRKERSSRDDITDAAPGWFVYSDAGYLTTVGAGANMEVVQATDFTITVKGRLTLPSEQIWIVDLHTSEGVLENQHLSSRVTSSSTSLQRWLHGRGCAILPHTGDKRGSYGSRLLMLMKSQDFPELGVTEHYGWHPELGQFITAEGVFDATGNFGPYTTTHPNPRLVQTSPVNYGSPTTESMASARSCLSQLLSLQDHATTRIIGAWLMMLLLRDQWQGTFPGLLVEAFAGTGKTTFFKIFSALAGVPQQGNNMTRPAARDYAAGNANGFAWFDDVVIDDATSQLIRKIVTRGTEALKTQSADGWSASNVSLLSSVIVTDESVDWHRQKAFRDRFISVKFESHGDRSAVLHELHDTALATRGALLPLVLRNGGPLLRAQWPTLVATATDRVSEVDMVITMGASILAAVLDDPSWTVGSGAALDSDLDSASECVLKVFPTLWRALGYPESAGAVNGRTGVGIWYDATTLEFKIHGPKVADAWAAVRTNVRQAKLTDQRAIKRELDACGAGPGVQTWVGWGGSEGTNIRYRNLPEKYSSIVRRIALDEHVD